MPSGWTDVTRPGNAAPRWEILKDSSAPTKPYVFAQVSHDQVNTAGPLAILNGSDLRDGEVSVKFKPVTASRNGAAGLVFRYQDPLNYCSVRANTLANEVTVVRVQNGRPTAAYKVRHQVRPNDWNILKVTFNGPSYSVYYDHRRILRAVDAGFTGSGKVGLWTRSDGVAYFDNFRVSKKG